MTSGHLNLLITVSPGGHTLLSCQYVVLFINCYLSLGLSY